MNQGPSAKLKDEEMQMLICGTLGDCGTELFYVETEVSVDGTPQREKRGQEAK